MGESVRLLRVSTVAKKWDCSRQYIYALIQAGKLPYVIVGGAIRIEEGVADKYPKKNPA